MAIAVQANLVALKVEWSRRMKIASDQHAIHTPPPGAVTRFRETLLDRRVIHDYANDELLFKTRQVWGEFALMCWAFVCDNPHCPPDFADLPAGQPFRSLKELLRKEAEITNALWRLRHEQRLRQDPDLRREPAFQQEHEFAQSLPVRVYDMDVRLAALDDLVHAACEHAGMLAAVRWLIDDRRTWDEPGLMDLGKPRFAP